MLRCKYVECGRKRIHTTYNLFWNMIGKMNFELKKYNKMGHKTISFEKLQSMKGLSAYVYNMNSHKACKQHIFAQIIDSFLELLHH